jgi:hypothetical protein
MNSACGFCTTRRGNSKQLLTTLSEREREREMREGDRARKSERARTRERERAREREQKREGERERVGEREREREREKERENERKRKESGDESARTNHDVAVGLVQERSTENCTDTLTRDIRTSIPLQQNRKELDALL